MISLEQRSLLTDALTPPADYSFNCGIATTYSLDLITLLTLPLHLAWLGSTQTRSGEIDPLAILEALRRTAGKLTVFYQRGRMQIPRAASPLLALLEGMVHQVSARHGGAFHPKVWLLKFTAADPAAPPKMRLLILSRNLTDDRSWDLSLTVDGLVGRKPISQNKPLRMFFEQTQAMSHKSLTPGRHQENTDLLDDAMRCVWELPGRFDELHFHVLGAGRKLETWLPRPPGGVWDALGVVSPFVTSGALERLAGLSATPLFLMARPEELDKLAEPMPGGFQSLWVLDDRAESGDEDDDLPGALRGLHAKAYVGKRGWNTHLFLGSANATDAALVAGRNVEFMAELVGRCSKVGRPEDWQGDAGLGPVLTPYVRSDPAESAEELHAQKLLEELRARLAGADLRLRCAQAEAGWQLELHGIGAVEREGVAVRVWPLSLKDEHAIDVSSTDKSSPLLLGLLAKQDLTSFTGFTLRLEKHELSFALDLPASGFPDGRDLEILRTALRNKDGFLRYLLLLLGDWEPGGNGADEDESKQWRAPWRAGVLDEVPLFELLSRAFAHDPQRLVQIGKVIARLSTETADGHDEIVPPEFLVMWKSFEQALKDEAIQ